MPVLPAFGDPPPVDALAAAATALRAGQPVVLPTDTVYGLAVDAAMPGATERLYAIKRRPADIALAVLVAGVDQALELAGELPAPARRLMERFWPGGLTVIVPRRPGLDLDLGGVDDSTIGLRLPAHPVPARLARQVGPLATTSANRHGEATPATAAAVSEHLEHAVDVVLDAGRCAGAPSTVVACGGDGIRILREGSVPSAEVESAANG